MAIVGRIDAREAEGALEGERKSDAIYDAHPGAAAERLDDGTVRLSSYSLARQLLRSKGTREGRELYDRFANPENAPILYCEGEAHRRKRNAIAGFFSPKAVEVRYSQLITEASERIIAALRSTGRADLHDMCLELAMAVGADLVGLERRAGLTRRVKSFLYPPASGHGLISTLCNVVANRIRLLRFYMMDVRPAIARRRSEPRDDILSQLAKRGYSTGEMLIDSITYISAGVVTTAEFLVMAAWHLFENAELRQRFIEGSEAERTAILQEILRLEPVANRIYRRATTDLSLDDNGVEFAIPSGARIIVDIASANLDESAVGKCPRRLDSDRQIDGKPAARSLSFGDGPHRCPGADLALQEGVLFLHAFFKVPGITLTRPPSVRQNRFLETYELRGAVVTADVA